MGSPATAGLPRWQAVSGGQSQRYARERSRRVNGEFLADEAVSRPAGEGSRLLVAPPELDQALRAEVSLARAPTGVRSDDGDDGAGVCRVNSRCPSGAQIRS
jgi:hypothetical protein